jgi:hypothetical protein
MSLQTQDLPLPHDPMGRHSSLFPRPRLFPTATVITLAYLAMRSRLPRLFSDDPQVIETASSTMVIVCAFLPFDHAMVRYAGRVCVCVCVCVCFGTNLTTSHTATAPDLFTSVFTFCLCALALYCRLFSQASSEALASRRGVQASTSLGTTSLEGASLPLLFFSSAARAEAYGMGCWQAQQFSLW